MICCKGNWQPGQSFEFLSARVVKAFDFPIRATFKEQGDL